MTVKYDSDLKSYDQGSSVWKLDQTPRSRSLGQQLWYGMKGLVKRNASVIYESPFSSGSKVMTKVNIFEKLVKFQGIVANYGMVW